MHPTSLHLAQGTSHVNQGKVPGSKLRWHGTRRPHLRLSALHQASCWPAGHILRAGKSAGTPSAGQSFARAPCGKIRGSDAGQDQRWHRSNNAFKPSPLRGLVQVLLDFPLAQGRKSVRLNSALDRSRKRCRSTSVKPSGSLFFPRLLQAFDLRHKLRAG